MNYFLHLNNDALEPAFLQRLESALNPGDIQRSGHTCLASWLHDTRNLAAWFSKNFKKDSLSHRLTLLALLEKDTALMKMEPERHDVLMRVAYDSLYDDDHLDISEALYATGTAFIYHNISVRAHDDKMGLMREMYIPLSCNDTSINFDGRGGEDYFSGDLFPFLGKLLRSHTLGLKPYLCHEDDRWMCDLLETCAKTDILYLPKASKRSLIEELYVYAACTDEQAASPDRDEFFAFKISSDIVQYASEMGRLALLKGHPSHEVMSGVAEVAQVMAEHFSLNDDVVSMLMRFAQVHAGIIAPQALRHLDTPFNADDLFGPSGEWDFPPTINAQFTLSNLKLGILSSYESSVDSIDWVPIYHELLNMAGLDAYQFIDLKGNVSLCQNIYLKDAGSDYFKQYLDAFLNSPALETTEDNGIYFLSRRLRYRSLEASQLRRLQQLELKSLCRPNRINTYLVEHYRGHTGLTIAEALGYLDGCGGLNSLDALNAVGADFNDLKPYHRQLTTETKRHFLSNDLDI